MYAISPSSRSRGTSMPVSKALLTDSHKKGLPVSRKARINPVELIGIEPTAS